MTLGGPEEPLLPWGWWLRVNGDALEAPDGREYGSVREAFWCGLLKFPTALMDAHLEFLFRVLLGFTRHRGADVEQHHDLFASDPLYWRFYISWLQSIGLLENGSAVSRFGRSVLLMLQATRHPEPAELPMVEIVEAVRREMAGPETQQLEQALQAFERQAGQMPTIFAREQVGRSHLITLTIMDTDSQMSLRRVVWSIGFADRLLRDRLFAWLAERVHCWERWGELAYVQGAAALTNRLITMALADSRD
ncbi:MULTISPECIES: hypothetical protein [unclassified Sphingomonas]|jgi:hypothetical protein|uniref:hypothetical protein n=1 Tax=unclassified Sphingomonas TaxID=196159 RepID=UPI0008324DBE|nr:MULTISPECIES: hypothetical protein [unclassified Sphingomonas]